MREREVQPRPLAKGLRSTRIASAAPKAAGGRGLRGVRLGMARSCWWEHEREQGENIRKEKEEEEVGLTSTRRASLDLDFSGDALRTDRVRSGRVLFRHSLCSRPPLTAILSTGASRIVLLLLTLCDLFTTTPCRRPISGGLKSKPSEQSLQNSARQGKTDSKQKRTGEHPRYVRITR